MSDNRSLQLVNVDFDGNTIEAVQTPDGEVFASLKRMCEDLGIQVQPQAAKLKTKEWATTTMIVVVAEDGKERELLMLHKDSIPGWLFSISPSKIAPDLRPRLVVFQKKAARALADFFYGRTQHQSAPNRDYVTREDLMQFLTAFGQTIMSAVTSLVQQQHPKDDNKALASRVALLECTQMHRVGDTVEVRVHINKRFGRAKQPLKKRIGDRAVSRIKDLGGTLWTRLGRVSIERDYLFILDEEIDREMAMEDNLPASETPLFDRILNN